MFELLKDFVLACRQTAFVFSAFCILSVMLLLPKSLRSNRLTDETEKIVVRQRTSIDGKIGRMADAESETISHDKRT